MIEVSYLVLYYITEMVPEDIQSELKQQYTALCELLRHFWCCFPASTKFLEEKVSTLNLWSNLINSRSKGTGF